MKKSYLLFILSTILISEVWARPEYAVREKTNCINCHVSPYGAGHRRVFGKVYGSREMSEAKTSDNDLYYADVRAVEYLRAMNSNKEVRGGLGLMMAEAGVKVDIFESSEEEGRSFDTSLVLSHDFGSFAAGTRNVYIMASKVESLEPINSMLFGRFYSPFGLMTDEHRTYTKMVSDSKYNKDFVMGFMLSGNFTEAFHYDVALTNGLKAGGFVEEDQESVGSIVNMRWNPKSMPFMLGTSLKYIHIDDAEADASKVQHSPYAGSFYSIFDLYNLTNGSVPLSIQGEFVQAHNYNDSSTSDSMTMLASGAYLDGIKRSISNSYVILMKYDLNNQWKLIAKYDHLYLNKDHELDYHELFGLGVRYQFNANMNVQFRLENAKVTRSDLEGIHSGFDDFFIVFRAWI